MATDKELETAATQLLNKHGYRSDGTPLSEPRHRQVPYGTLSPARLEALRPVRGAGGMMKCCYGDRNRDLAVEFDDNIQTGIAHTIEDRG